MRPASDFFLKLNFNETQLNAIVQIYHKYFYPHMPEKYAGTGVIALWKTGSTWETGKGADIGHAHKGIVSEECQNDPLWQEFSDILPFMGQSATITKITPGAVMVPHVDRAWRPNAIYFPISGCSDRCISEYYNIPKLPTKNSQSIQVFPKADYSFSVNESAYLNNVHEWHSVRNTSNIERTAFGWNFASANYSFDYCKNALTKAGYVHSD